MLVLVDPVTLPIEWRVEDPDAPGLEECLDEYDPEDEETDNFNAY